MGTLPSSLGNLTSLLSLSLTSNLLYGTAPPSLIDLNALTFLSLQDNFFTGALPPLAVHTLQLSLNRFDPTAISPSSCAAACASSPDAFACPAPPATANACAPTCASLPCAPACPVSFNATDALIVAYACQGAFSSCTACASAQLLPLVERGIPLNDTLTLGRCISDATPFFLAASASPVALDGLRSCVPVTCPVTLPASAFVPALASCPPAVLTQNCTRCFAALIAPFAAASPTWPAMDLATLTKQQYSLLETCLYEHSVVLEIAGFSVQTMEGLVPCVVVAPSATPSSPSASPPAVSQGGVAGIVIAGIVFFLCLGMGVTVYLARTVKRRSAAAGKGGSVELGEAPVRGDWTTAQKA